MRKKTGIRLGSAVLAFIAAEVPATHAQQTTFKLDPAKTTVNFTLEASLHSVHGTFHFKPSTLQLDPASGKGSRSISVDAKSGVTRNGMRDRKMHRDVLESEQYPDISFDPDRFSGAVTPDGKSAVMVHGMFRIHDGSREVTVPASLEMQGSTWKASVHFTVPSAKWSMKTPRARYSCG